VSAGVTSYAIQLHPRADEELQEMPDRGKDRLTDTLQEVASTRAPSSHERVISMNGPDGLMRVRAGEYRAVIILSKPNLLVLRVGHRKDVYPSEADLGNRLNA
jgi:mRNA-degrading endonuclease RelE of RelBE toxin-antitoxin system